MIKTRASDALIAAGGTITHHHAVGRDHMPWYRAQRPDLFGKAFAAAKSALDPAGIMNPGVLVHERLQAMMLVPTAGNPVPDGAVAGEVKTRDGAALRFARWDAEGAIQGRRLPASGAGGVH